MTGPETSRPNCDRLAPYYHFLETVTVGRAFQNARCAFLPEVTTTRRALLCGDGDGRFLARLLQTNSTVTVDFVDLSAKMIELAQQRAARLDPTHLERVRFFHQDVTEFSPPAAAAGYDLVATHFFLDCFAQQEISQIVSRIAAWAAPQAKWLVSDVRQAPNSVSKIWTRAAIRTLYAAFNSTTGLRITELPRYTDALAATGCQPQQEKITAAGLFYSSLWQCPAHRSETT